MGRKISFAKEYKPKGTERLAKLNLKKDERARIALLGDMEAEYVHNLTKVLIDEDTGKAVMETRTGNNGNSWETPSNEFVGRFVCTGDFDSVAANRIDPDNCVLCQASADSGAFSPPIRYMVSMVLQYETKAGTFNAQLKPFQGRVLPWMFTDGKWNILHGIDEEYQELGGVHNMDLMLGPCDSGTFQNFDIRPGSKCEWKADEKRVEYVKELLDGYEGDISTLFGRRSTPTELKRFIREIQDTWDAAFSPNGDKSDNIRSSSSEAVDSLFGEDTNEYSSDESDEISPESTADDSNEEENENRDAGKVKQLSDLLDF